MPDLNRGGSPQPHQTIATQCLGSKGEGSSDIAEFTESSCDDHTTNPADPYIEAWLDGEVSTDIDRLAAFVVDADAYLTPDEIEERLTADLDMAIAAAEAGDDLTPDARRLHGLSAPAAVPIRWQGMPLRQLRAERDRLVRAWAATLAAADYRADKLQELEAAPDAAAAVDAVARWNLLDGAPRLTVDPPAAEPPVPLPGASKAELHASVLGHVAGFFARAEDPRARRPRVLLTAETGSRKTGIGLAHLKTMIDARKAAGRPHRAILAVPAHKLGREALVRAQAEGINAALFQGRGESTCQNLEAADLARQAGADVRATVCGPNGKGRCAWRDSCVYFAGLARAKTVDLVIVAHNFLFDPLPAEVRHDLAWVVVDEGFAGLADRIRDLTLGTLAPESLARAPVLIDDTPDAEATAELGRLYAMVEAAARACLFDGYPAASPYLTADALRAAGFTAVSDAPARMRRLTWKREIPVQMWPGMDPDSRKAAARLAATNGQLAGIAGLTHALEAILTGGDAGAGLVSVRLDVKRRGSETVLTVRGQKEPAAWMADLPVLMMDATGRLDDVQRVFDSELAEAPRAAWPHCEVHQITGGFGRSTMARHKTRLAELRDFSALSTMDEPAALVVTHKSAEDTFMGMPGIVTAHHGAIAGLDAHAMVDAAFIIGGTFASPEDVASIAAARGGGAVAVARPERAMRAALLTSGAAVGIECLVYGDPAADAVHRGIYDASIIQAIGRVRPIERTANNPAVVYVFANVALPFPVASVTAWKDRRPDRVARMIAGGIVWTNATDMATYRPDLFKSAKAAEGARRRAAGTVADMREAVWQTVRHDPRPWVEIAFQPPGQGQRQRPIWCPAGAEAAAYAAIEAETGTPVRWRVSRFTAGREDTLAPGKLSTYPGMAESSSAPDAGSAFYGSAHCQQAAERPPDG
jgi:hypothetical protein